MSCKFLLSLSKNFISSASVNKNRISYFSTNKIIINAMSSSLVSQHQTEIRKWPENWIHKARLAIPLLSDDKHKGQAGRIGIIGGCDAYTGAPYFSAISALKTGVDLVHVFCTKSAAIVIKSYSPDLIVHPILDAENAVDYIQNLMNRLHVLVIGPGLGRDVNIMDNVICQIITTSKKQKMPLVIDADGLWIISQHLDWLKDWGKNGNCLILTPNAMEYKLLFNDDTNKTRDLFGSGVTVLRKGKLDQIYHNETGDIFTGPSDGGSGRRCGGQGDILSGTLAVFLHWMLEYQPKLNDHSEIACAAASLLTKECNRRAFLKYGRGMCANDMINEIIDVFRDQFEHDEYKNKK